MSFVLLLLLLHTAGCVTNTLGNQFVCDYSPKWPIVTCERENRDDEFCFIDSNGTIMRTVTPLESMLRTEQWKIGCKGTKNVITSVFDDCLFHYDANRCISQFILLIKEDSDDGEYSYGLINLLNGKQLITGMREITHYSSGFAMLTEDDCDADGDCHIAKNYIDTKGKLLFDIWLDEKSGPFHHGLARACLSPEGLQHRDCPDIPIETDIARDGDDGTTDAVFTEYIVCNKRYSPLCGIMDETGTFLIPQEYNYISEINEQTVIVGKYVNGEMRYGLMGVQGKVIIPIQYEDVNYNVEPLRDGNYVIARNTEGDEEVFDLDGSFLGKFSSVKSIDNNTGTMKVEINTPNGEFEYGFVNRNGSWLYKHKYGSDIINNKVCVSDVYGVTAPCHLMDLHGNVLSDYALAHYPIMDRKQPTGYHIIPLQDINNARYVPENCPFHEIVISPDNRIIWPPRWDNPCTETYGMVIWPNEACQKH